ncbi:MAG: sterol desaturase family protein [Gemmatimonadales bacterium]
MAKQYASNQDVSVRMFRSDLLERLTRVHPAVPHIIYLPLVGYLLYTGYQTEGSLGNVTGLFLAGFALWTIAEYTIHRFVFHVTAETEQGTHEVVRGLDSDEAAIPALANWRQVLYFIAHGVHHDFPNDSRRLVMPPGASIPLAFAFYVVFRVLFGVHTGPLFAGFVVGYLVYDSVHYAVHHFRPHTPLGRYLKKHHFRHHYQNSDLNFGVSSPVWDVVLRTLDRHESSALEMAQGK